MVADRHSPLTGNSRAEASDTSDKVSEVHSSRKKRPAGTELRRQSSAWSPKAKNWNRPGRRLAKTKAAEKARPGKTHRPCGQRFRSQLRAWHRIFEVEQENVAQKGAAPSHPVWACGETAAAAWLTALCVVKSGNIRQKWYATAEARYTKYTAADYHFHTPPHRTPESDEKCAYPATGRSNGSAGNIASRQRRLQSRRAAAGKTATATESPDCPGSGICQSHPAGAVVAVLCVLLLFAMAVLFLYACLCWGTPGPGALGASTYLARIVICWPPKPPIVRWKMIYSIIWTPMKGQRHD